MQAPLLSLILTIAAAAGLAAQPGQRAPLTPAETLLEPAILKAIDDTPGDDGVAAGIDGSDAKAGVIALTCQSSGCEAATLAARKLRQLIASRSLTPPSRSIWIATPLNSKLPEDVLAVVHLAHAETPGLRIVRGLWSTAAIGDEVVELFARQTDSPVEVRAFERAGQPQLDGNGVPTTTIMAGANGNRQAAFAAAASAYFLATLPNTGAEALLSHLMVGAHARLAEDGRKAVAQMGTQQRASADVLNLVAQAIDREQRRIRSFSRFMPTPVDPMLDTRLTDMEEGLTGVWNSLGFTSSPYTPPAERIRGRGGEDRRVPSRTAIDGPLDPASDRVVSKAGPAARQLAIGKLLRSAEVTYEIVNFIDGKRSISDIRDAVSAEFAPVPLGMIVEYVELLAKIGALTIK